MGGIGDILGCRGELLVMDVMVAGCRGQGGM